MAPTHKLPSAANQDYFLHPDNLKLSKQLASQSPVDFKSDAIPNDLTPAQVECIHSQLRAWLKSKDIKKLADLLEREPTSIGHPVVFRQLAYLRELLYCLEESDLEFEDKDIPSIDPLDCDETVFPRGTKRIARVTLIQLTSAWVGAWIPSLRPYTMQPPKPLPRRGRPRQFFDEQLLPFLESFNECRMQLQKHGKKFFQPKRKEKKAAFVTRIAKAIRKVDLREAGISSSSLADTRRAVLKSLGKRGILLDPLIFNLLAHFTGWSPGQIRGYIQRAEQVFPKHHLRGPSAERW